MFLDLHKSVWINKVNARKLHEDDNREYIIVNRKYFIPRFHGLRMVQLRRTIKSYIAYNASRAMCQKGATFT